MKRRSREVSIFSMSALDLFASALGAFILIAIVMFPYFPNTADQGDLDEVRDALDRERRRKFLLVTISWDDEDDVDLHVVDPAGNEFHYAARTHAGTPARFEEDAVEGPGNELWLHPRVAPGEYRVYYNLFTEEGDPGVSVRGAVAHSVDRIELPPRRLTRPRDRTLVATVVVDADMNVGVRHHREEARFRPQPRPPASERPDRPDRVRPREEEARSGCGDERDRLIREYVERGLQAPECGDLSSRGGSPHFPFSDLNSGDYVDPPWAWITDSLTYGLERMRDRYGRPLRVNSGYRNPVKNDTVSDAPRSPHQFGRAVDIDAVTNTEAEIKALKIAADDAGASYVKTYGGHVHVLWD